MAKRPSKQGVSTGILVVLLAGVLVSQALQAGASHQPADKVNASASKIEVVPPGEATPILSETFKTSSPTDLMIHLTLECSIITELLNTGGPDVESSHSEAEGRIRVWLEFDGVVVPIQETSTNPQPHDPTSPGNDTDKVTFCNNEQRFTVTDAEDDGTDTYNTYLRTKTANAFNWVYLNTGNGLHDLEVFAEFDEGETPSNTPGSTSSGLVGNRMLIIEPTKMSNHESTVDPFEEPAPPPPPAP